MKTKTIPNTKNTFEATHPLEWLETNGLGGYASGTVSGAHSRRYHGLLVAAMHPPVGRTVVLSKLDETLIINGQRFELGANQYPGVIHPKGFEYLTSFDRDLFPEFFYEACGVKLKKTVAAIHGENTTVVLYEVQDAPQDFTLELLPLCSARDYHSVSHANGSIYTGYLFNEGVFQTKNYQDSPELFIHIPGSSFNPSGSWYHNFEYSIEQYRGLDFQEDLFNHGTFAVNLKKGSNLGIIISTENPAGKDAFTLFDQEQTRRKELTKDFTWNTDIKRLVLAADQFVVRRGDDLKTVIAGYHWFSDWGRDTMISLPGLCLVTGRYDDAKKILKAFAESVSEGMLPNRFPDQGETPEYNTVDATLWFFHAIYKYYHYTADKKFIKSILPVLKNIIAWHDRGTRYNIHVDSDGLLYSGQDGVQLTWMDAKVGNWVVTPRTGKAVEINALWYNALCITAELLDEIGDKKEAEEFVKRSTRVSFNFDQTFWNESRQCLYDYVNGDYRNDDLRPNQIYAISLPFALLPKDKALKVLDTVTEKLLTTRGLRSLSPDHLEYRPNYGGDQWHRDGAYHEGTVWSFLLGSYLDAVVQLKKNAKAEAARILKTFLEHLNETGIGTVSEIFDSEPPYHPRGCMAQAWGVAEALRVALEYDLFPGPKKGKKNKSKTADTVLS